MLGCSRCLCTVSMMSVLASSTHLPAQYANWSAPISGSGFLIPCQAEQRLPCVKFSSTLFLNFNLAYFMALYLSVYLLFFRFIASEEYYCLGRVFWCLFGGDDVICTKGHHVHLLSDVAGGGRKVIPVCGFKASLQSCNAVVGFW